MLETAHTPESQATCDQAILKSNNLTRHTFRVRPDACDTCGRACLQSGNLTPTEDVYEEDSREVPCTLQNWLYRSPSLARMTGKGTHHLRTLLPSQEPRPLPPCVSPFFERNSCVVGGYLRKMHRDAWPSQSLFKMCNRFILRERSSWRGARTSDGSRVVRGYLAHR